MYAHLHMFQDLTTIIINQHRILQTKLKQFNIIREGMNEIDTWIAESLDALAELYCLSPRERKIDAYALEHFPKIGQKIEKTNDKLNRNMFTHTQSGARTTQVVLTARARGACKKYYNGGTSQKGTRQHESQKKSHRGNHHSNIGPNITTLHPTKKGSYYFSGIHGCTIKGFVGPR
jgi:hypothetical protein